MKLLFKLKLFVILLLIITSCTISKKIVKINPVLNSENYFNYFSENPNLQIHSLNPDEIDSIITSYLKKKGFIVIRDAVFETSDNNVVPINGFLPYEKVGYFIETTFSYPKLISQRKSDVCEYAKYTHDSIGYLLRFNVVDKNLFIFRTNSYWWQEWIYKEKIDKNKILVSKEFAYKLLSYDIENYFGNIEPKKKRRYQK